MKNRTQTRFSVAKVRRLAGGPQKTAAQKFPRISKIFFSRQDIKQWALVV
jgi:hypothetical protein